MSKIKKLAKKIIEGNRASSEDYISHLRKIGMIIGEDVTIYAPSKTLIDEQYPWMIKIGDHVRITEGVKILTHDYSWSVMKTTSGVIAGASGTVEIGNNVFIGMNSIILRNVKIGDNVIIGTGSVVTKDCEPNSVYAGVPAKKVASLEDYSKKRIDSQLEEAKLLAKNYYSVYGKKPEKEIFHEYFMLFESPENIRSNETFNNKMSLCQNADRSFAYLENNKPHFDSYDDFMRFCFDE